MGASAIVMAHVLAKDALEMAFAQRNREVQTLPPDRPDQSFTESVRLRRSNRSLQNSNAESFQCAVAEKAPRFIATTNLAATVSPTLGSLSQTGVSVQGDPVR